MCHPDGLLFHQKSVDMGPILVKNILIEGPISQKFEKKMVKLAIFEVEKLLEMGPYLQKFWKNCQIRKGEKREKNP